MCRRRCIGYCCVHFATKKRRWGAVPIHNSDISAMFSKVAELLEIQGANQFRVRAYRNAARTIKSLSKPVATMIDDGADLTEISGIGEDLAQKIEEIVTTSTLELLDRLKQETNPELTDLLHVEGLGPKRVQQLHRELGISTLAELEQAARQQKIQELDGFGEKMQAKILEHLQRASQEEERRILFMTAEEIVSPLREYVQAAKGVEEVVVAGSYRRRKETIGDIDMLVTGETGEDIIQHFIAYEDVEEVISEGSTRSTVRLRSGLHVDLRVVPQKSYGAALLYFTGSKAHNVHLRTIAQEHDLKINEYGVFQGDQQVVGVTEAEIYAHFDLRAIPPELREDRGEIEAAAEGTLPTLVTLEDIRGDLQMHTTASDGTASLKEMAQAARDLGYAYIAITDHSPRVSVAQGLNVSRLEQLCETIDQFNAENSDFRVLKSAEVDILKDGSLDYPDDVLKKLDLAVCSIHSYFNLSRDQQTERILRAMDNPYFSILAHPTGRLIGKREPYELDLERVMEAALERGCFLELNANPERLDLNDVQCKMAKDMGLNVVISTDAHRPDGLHDMRFGIAQARRGWLEAGDVINTRPLNDLQKLLTR
ncbi:DNA polymerase/3'-5' exonuclease PolX [candidate division KSB3 bacterium]|uniref:DNA polymerase beta n=1 Tax=candidate division KSB3 bacterium TaxID=2044937 RepID=A0A9D5Q563_9BACT|nr:DNA polymerase/3'-5' exonuclease PolX [candidate division KSB3 bacterium]MBD3323596.1 DNA polymerase/3'-5' exonuclease PolX [candidate division KSB3 bacterium]